MSLFHTQQAFTFAAQNFQWSLIFTLLFSIIMKLIPLKYSTVVLLYISNWGWRCVQMRAVKMEGFNTWFLIIFFLLSRTFTFSVTYKKFTLTILNHPIGKKKIFAVLLVCVWIVMTRKIRSYAIHLD